jgi:hypothetical protein
MGHHGLLASGPFHLHLSLNFKISTNFVIQMLVFLMFKIHQILQVDSLNHKENFYFLDQF